MCAKAQWYELLESSVEGDETEWRQKEWGEKFSTLSPQSVQVNNLLGQNEMRSCSTRVHQKSRQEFTTETRRHRTGNLEEIRKVFCEGG